MGIPQASELEIRKLGEGRFTSPVVKRGVPPVNESDRVFLPARVSELEASTKAGETPPSFEQAGARERIYFNPSGLTCGIVTCGGLCPGLNDVIRSIVMTLSYGYGVKRIVGFPYGYYGLSKACDVKPMMLDPRSVAKIQEHGGTMLGSSRGSRDLGEMVDTLVSWDVSILFTIGGDGTLRGASALTKEIEKRNLKISVIGIPKTIDNDLEWIARSFGFITAVHEARPAIQAAHAEAKGARHGVGLVKLMGRHSGFIATYASLANPDVNYCLIPEVPFSLRGEGGFFPVLFERLEQCEHAVVIVAEGAGQDLVADASASQRDASGNVKLDDIGVFLRDEIVRYGREQNVPVSVKYIDPSYTIRSQPANSNDSAYCLVLGQNAVHAGMAGRTDIVMGFWNNQFTHVPIAVATGERKHVDPRGEAWQYLLQMTGQPASMVSA